jgi:hypothetical protein
MGTTETTIKWTRADIEGGYIFAPYTTAIDEFENGHVGSSAARVTAYKVCICLDNILPYNTLHLPS